MMGWRQKLKSGDEWDVLTGWRRVMCYLSHPGVTKRIKQRMNRRARHEAKQELRRYE